jgi:hypothetical protein
MRGVTGKSLIAANARHRKAFSNPVSSAESLNNSSDGEDVAQDCGIDIPALLHIESVLERINEYAIQLTNC